jgi:uncharacterized protein DUF998
LYTLVKTTAHVAHKEVTAVAPTNHLPDQKGKQVALLAIFALVAVTYFVAVIIALHFLRPDRNPLMEPTSTYAVGRYGYLMTSAFISMSLGSLALAIGLYRGLPERRSLGLVLASWEFGWWRFSSQRHSPSTSKALHKQLQEPSMQGTVG